MLDILAWARRFVATPSVSRDGNDAISVLACELLAEAGAEPRRIPVEHEGTRHYTVVADLGPEPGERDAGLLLLTHLDTVPPGDPALWTETGGDPFAPTERGGLLFGLGSADAKVDLVCKAAALAQIDRARLEWPLRVVGSFAEEIGLVGARWLVREGLLAGFRHALVGEPSELCAIRAHKGYSVWRARIPLARVSAPGRAVEETCQGESAHSSTPQLGANAIDTAFERLSAPDVRGVLALEGGGAVNQVPAQCRLGVLRAADGAPPTDAYETEPLVAFHLAWRDLLARLAERKDPDFDPDHTVGNLGRVSLAGDVCELTFDLRPIPGVDAHEVLTPLAEHAELDCVRSNPPLATPADARLLGAVRAAQRAAGLPECVATKATCTEAGVLAAAGLEVAVLGAGRSIGNVHRPNEHTIVAQLAQARDVYAHVIGELCGGSA